MTQEDIIIKVENVSKEYRLGAIDFHSFLADKKAKKEGKKSGRKLLKALDNVSFEIKKGEAVGLIGGNGAGKSTLLKILSHITVPSQGTVYIDGTMSSLLEVGTGFHPELSGRENIYINGTIIGMTRKEIDNKLEDIIEFSECRDFIDTPVKRYSSGMYVKLAFAVSAFLESEIMILDEVLSVGDVKFQNKCLDKIRELISKDDRTVICVSHNMNTISRFCNRCLVLDHGKLIFDGDTADAINNYYGIDQDCEVRCDYSKSRRFTWLTRDDVRTEVVEYVDKEQAVFYDDENIKLYYSWRYNKDINNLSLRFEVRDEKENPIATAVLKDFHSGVRGDYSDAVFDIDISWLKPGRYKTIYTLYTVNGLGISEDLDCIDGLSFEKKNTYNEGMVWVSKSWGNIELPNIKIIK